MMGGCGITGMEYSWSYSEVPKLIDFFKSEMPLRQHLHMGRKREYLCAPGNQQWSTNPTPLATSPERAIADSEERQLEPIPVDFIKGGNGDPHHHHDHVGVDAAVLNRSSSAVEVKHPMAKLKEAAGEDWSLQVANPPTALKILSPTSTGTEESGTAAPKTPTCDMEIAYSRPCLDQVHEHSSHQQGSTFSPNSGQFRDGNARYREMRKLLNGEACAESGGTSHGRKRLKRITPPSIRSEPLEQTPTSRFCDVSTQTQFSDPSQLHGVLEVEDEETEAVLQAATSLLSLASNEEIRRRPSFSSSGPLSEREAEGAGPSSVGACSSVLSRPSNKRRYRLLVDLLAET